MPIRKCPPELKERAVRLCRESPDRPLSQTADQLWINRETLRNWVQQALDTVGVVENGDRRGVRLDLLGRLSDFGRAVVAVESARDQGPLAEREA